MDNVYEDFDLDSVKEKDKIWSSRGTSAMVYDSAPVRFWDFWVGPKKPALFSVSLYTLPDHTWQMGGKFFSPLKETSHVREKSCYFFSDLILLYSIYLYNVIP